MTNWIDSVPVLEHFTQATDARRYVPVPSEWWIGISDVVDSTAAIAAGRYKAVNLAGAATLSAVSNALDGNLPLFAFSGDGASFVIPPHHADRSRAAMARVATWADRELDLALRVGMVQVRRVREAGFDVCVAFWPASPHVRYAMFRGGGLAWSEAQLKSGAISVPRADDDTAPDLSGLSCQWGPLRTHRGAIVSLIARPTGQSSDGFDAAMQDILAILDDQAASHPVPHDGPPVRWPGRAVGLQALVTDGKVPLWRRKIRAFAMASLAWILFKTGLRLGRFSPGRYRRELAENTDFRKFDDGLLMTIDCTNETVAALRRILEDAGKAGVLRYGMHLQEQALITCIVPSLLATDHLHFIDGADGGYTAAAKAMGKTP